MYLKPIFESFFEESNSPRFIDSLKAFIEFLEHEPNKPESPGLTQIESVNLVQDDDLLKIKRIYDIQSSENVDIESKVEYFVDALCADYWEVCQRAAFALMEIGNTKAIRALLDIIPTEPTEEVLWAINIYLGAPHYTESAVAVLIDALQHHHAWVRLTASGALSAVGSEAAVPALLNALHDEDYNVHNSAAGALGRIGGETAISGLLNELQNNNPHIRKLAANTLGALGSKKTTSGASLKIKIEQLSVVFSFAFSLQPLSSKIY